MLPVALLGSSAFDVSRVNRGSVRLEGVAPAKWAYEDVNYDGATDIVFQFKTSQLVAAGLYTDGNELTLSGQLNDGALFEGSDIIRLAGGPGC